MCCRQRSVRLNRIVNNFTVMPYHKIRIMKGAEIKTTHPKGGRVCRRNQVVQTHTRSGPLTDDVTWRGSGGYWFWTKKENCELIA